ncbi:MAG: glycosyltransferase family 4 protein [Alphaproteobacteria bacterium]
MEPYLGIDWGIANYYGWGVFGYNLCAELAGDRNRPTVPVPLSSVADTTMNPAQLARLKPLLAEAERFRALPADGSGVTHCPDMCLLKALGNDLTPLHIERQYRGDRTIGFVFLENTNLSAAAMQRARTLDMVIAGSTWNARILQAKGLSDVRCALQGIDTALFRPRSTKRLFGDRFTVFSGGKLEYRKGQDIVLAAWKKFHAAHPDSVLVTAWHNVWPETARSIAASPHIDHAPETGPDNRLKIVDWAEANGAAPGSVIDLGIVANEETPNLMRAIDIAVFPNRCEGGTNLVAMETMASGVPCILSANTGHLDLIGDGAHCLPLTHQRQVIPPEPDVGVEGWGESSVDDVVAALEHACENHDATKKMGLQAAIGMKDWSWKNRIRQLMDILTGVKS